MRTRTATSQAQSARRMVVESGITHDDVATGELTVGVTAGGGADPQMVHFCSADLTDVQILKRGDGQELPEPYGVVVRGGTPVVPTHGLLRFRVEIHPNGSLNLRQRTLRSGRKRARFVTAPETLLSRYPWAHAGGPQEMADAYGCESVEEMFQLHGVEVS